MGKQFMYLLWSIFTGEPMDFGSILWDDFLTYVGRNEPRTGLTEVTSARFSSLWLKDHLAATNISLRRTWTSSSVVNWKGTLFPIKQLLLHILTEVGLITHFVSNRMEATNDVLPYHSTLPKSIDLITRPKGNRNKHISRKEASNVVEKTKTKRKTFVVTKQSTEVHPTSEPHHTGEPLNEEEPEDSQPLIRKRRAYTTSPTGQNHHKAHTRDSQKSPVAIGLNVESPERPLSINSGSSSGSVSARSIRNRTQSGFQVDQPPNVSERNQQHIFTLQELNSILFHLHIHNKHILHCRVLQIPQP